ncbi:MAG: YtxH domain-containing protein [Nitrospira sp.]
MHKHDSSALSLTAEQDVMMHNGNHYYERTGHVMGWSYFIAGALIGTGVTLLFAPQSGTELRGMLCNYANRVKDDLLDWAEETYDVGEEILGDAGQSTSEFAKQGQETVKDAGRTAKVVTKRSQDMVREPRRSAL